MSKWTLSFEKSLGFSFYESLGSYWILFSLVYFGYELLMKLTKCFRFERLGLEKNKKDFFLMVSR